MARRYWLLKSDPETFGWEHLERAPKRRTVWDGIRNPQARNHLRDDIQKGDGALFYHSGGEKAVDAVVVVSAPHHVQRARVLEREGMDEAKLDAILARQMADVEKRARAHFIVDTSQGLDHARAQVRHILASLRRDGVPAVAGGSEPTH